MATLLSCVIKTVKRQLKADKTIWTFAVILTHFQAHPFSSIPTACNHSDRFHPFTAIVGLSYLFAIIDGYREIFLSFRGHCHLFTTTVGLSYSFVTIHGCSEVFVSCRDHSHLFTGILDFSIISRPFTAIDSYTGVYLSCRGHCHVFTAIPGISYPVAAVAIHS
jgi:hypothetical protein